MPFIDTGKLEVFEKGIGGWRGRQFHSPSMTFCHWEFDNGASVHEHSHAQEEVWEILAGELEVTIDGITQIAAPGVVAIVPAHHHPTDEYLTVITGDFSLGVGDKLDETKSADLTAGGFAEAPAQMNHFAWTKSGAVVQVWADGP